MELRGMASEAGEDKQGTDAKCSCSSIEQIYQPPMTDPGIQFVPSDCKYL